MNKYEKIIKQFKALFSVEETEATEIKFEDVKAGDKVYRVSALEVDGTIQEVPTDGSEELIDVEDGDITLDDGTVLSVASGVITAMVEGEKDEEDASVDETEVTLSRLYSRNAREGFTEVIEGENMFTKVSQIWKSDWEVINTTFELGEIVTYKSTWNAEDETIYTLSSGQYELEDGLKFFVDFDGKIVMRILADGTVEAIDVAPAEDVEAPVTETPTEEMSAVNFSAEFMDGFSKMLDEFSSMKSEITSLKADIAKYAKAPSTEATKTKVEFKDVDSTVNQKPKSVLHSMLK